MYVISLLASNALAVDWTASGITGSAGLVPTFNSQGQPIYMSPQPFVTGIVESLVPFASAK